MKTAANTLLPLKINLAARGRPMPAPTSRAWRRPACRRSPCARTPAATSTTTTPWTTPWTRCAPDELAQNVAAWASFIYLVADSDIDFRALSAAAPAAAGTKA
jgi:hypothetical protein